MSDETVYTFEEMLAVEHMKPSPCLYLTRKTLIEEFDITFLKGVIHEDEIYTAKLAHHAKRIGLVRERFYHRRYRANSTMTGNTKSHLLKKMNGYKSVIHGLTDLYYEEFSELEVNEKKWLEHKIEYFFRILWEMPGNDKIDLLLLETELPVQLKHSKKALILLKMLPVLRRVFPIYKKIKTSIVKEEG
ncbi:MAG: hypothetical protein LBD38_03095, partial [Streptococcaceae bacterium]|jgi:hypothetical protein|nr:hypothetical protein [Streptococcaceae bacterium]